MTDARYNGWTNYATWVVALWLDNEQGTQEHWAEQARAAVEAEDFDMDAARRTLAGQLKDEHEEAMPQTTGVFADLMGYALGSVDWDEVADHYMSDIEVYSSGWNMPGYMPDETPARFLSAEEAREYVAESIEDASETVREEDDALSAEMADEAQRVREGAGEYGKTLGDYHYFVTRL
ncbi:hypothetical protein QCE62_00315 [Caballeronia sp. LZ033]|uniref:DUF7249 family protein n=1 Tax=Caballeronia sp. LZ033 TaxID=3038566 RepID=UPI00285569A2|nr:hypothetical protein [Caballeronia sp. LZ033]MDR5812031.1 hypothetical protein [Caballeronia sp. LZ033]